MRAAAMAALLLLAGLESGPVRAAPAAPLSLPDDAERRLAAGEIILLDTLPPGASSLAADFVMPMTAAFVAAYTTSPGLPTMPMIEEMLMIDPAPLDSSRAASL